VPKPAAISLPGHRTTVPKPSKKLTLAALQIGVDKPRPEGIRPLFDFLPDVPKTPKAPSKPSTPRSPAPETPGRTSGRERKSQDYSKLAAGHLEEAEKEKHDVQALSPLALAITLCDSLHAAAFDDMFEAPQRMAWKTKIANPDNSLVELGECLKEFEESLEGSAFVPQYEEVPLIN